MLCGAGSSSGPETCSENINGVMDKHDMENQEQAVASFTDRFLSLVFHCKQLSGGGQLVITDNVLQTVDHNG